MLGHAVALMRGWDIGLEGDGHSCVTRVWAAHV